MNAITNGVLLRVPDALRNIRNNGAFLKLMKQIIITILLAISSLLGYAQIITTYAGGGTMGLGDGGLANAAQLNLIDGIAFGRYGDLYIADGNNNRIRKVNYGTNIISTIAGNGMPDFSGDNGLAINAQFNNPEFITIDSSGNIFISDLNNNRIRKIDFATGIVTTIVGNGTVGFSGDSGLATMASLHTPGGLAIDNNNNLYFVDIYNNRIRKVDNAGIISTYAGTGVAGYSGDNGPAIAAQIQAPRQIAVDANGNLYLGASGRLRKIDVSTSIITTLAGDGTSGYNGDEILAINAKVGPTAVAIDKNGDIYLSDHDNNRVRKIDGAGIIHTVAGTGIGGFGGDNGLAGSAKLYFPQGIAFDTCGNLYIADEQNKRVRKVAFNPNCLPEIVKDVNTTDDINLYPNPTSDHVTITGGKTINDIAVINVIGQTMMEQNANSSKIVLNVEGLQSGVYFVKVSDESGGVVMKKVIKD